MHESSSIHLGALLATIVVFIVNALIPSFVNGFTEGLNFDLTRLWENIRSEEIYYFRLADSEFARKLFVLGFQKACNVIGIPFQFAFNLINFTALFYFFVASYRLTKTGLKTLNPYVYCFFIALSFPILFAFLPVIFTYDDIVQFLFLSLFINTLYSKKNFQAYGWFLLACLAKETTIFFGAFLLPYFWIQKRNLKQVFIELIPYGCLVFLYFIIIYFRFDDALIQGSMKYMEGKRFTFYKNNFSDLFRIVEVGYYILAVYLFPFVLWFTSPKIRLDKSIHYGFTSLAASNLIIALIAAQAVEARIYFMTLIPLLPFLAPQLQQAWDFLKDKRNFRPQLLIVSVLVSSVFISLYHPQVKRAYYVFAPYLFGYFTLCIYLLLSFSLNKKRIS